MTKHMIGETPFHCPKCGSNEVVVIDPDSTKQLIKNISSSYIRAKSANDDRNVGNELVHLLHAAHDISVLLTDRFDNRIDNACAYSYAKSLESSTKRIREIFGRGF